MKKFLLLFTLCCSSFFMYAQSGVKGLLTESGFGTPSLQCGSSNAGTLYTDYSTLPGTVYVCSSSVWSAITSSSTPTSPVFGAGVPAVTCNSANKGQVYTNTSNNTAYTCNTTWQNIQAPSIGVWDASIYGFDNACTLAKAAAASTNKDQTIVITNPNVSYTTVGCDLTTSVASGACVNIEGPGTSQFPGGLQATLTYNGVSGGTVIKHTATRASFGCHIRNINIDGANIAATGIDSTGEYRFYVDYIGVFRTTSTHIIVGSGVEYENFWNHILITDNATSNYATYTPTIVGGTITGGTIGNSGGSAYINPIAVINPPCTVNPTPSFTITSGVITNITWSGGSGCSASPNVLLPDVTGGSYGIISNVTDSKFEDIRPLGVGTVASMQVNRGNVRIYDLHQEVGQPAAFEDHGEATYYGLECDTPTQYCGKFYGYNSHVIGGSAFYNTAVTGAQGTQLWYFDNPTTSGQNTVSNFACYGAPTGGMTTLYNVNGTSYNVHDPSGLPAGTRFEIDNNCSNVTTATRKEVYGASQFDTNQNFWGGIQLENSTAGTSSTSTSSSRASICGYENTSEKCWGIQSIPSTTGTPPFVDELTFIPPSSPIATVIDYRFNDPINISPVTVSTLPSASNYIGRFITVSDSTTVAAEGQTCVGSGTVTALAFSDGTKWKCF